MPSYYSCTTLHAQLMVLRLTNNFLDVGIIMLPVLDLLFKLVLHHMKE